MKNQTTWLLLIIEILFLALLIGFFLGRNTADVPVRVSKLPAVTETTEPSQETNGTESAPPLMVNINTADLTELQKLPGIGPVLAKRIIEYRTAHGSFASLTDLTKVKGIGLDTLNKILDYATTGG